MAISLKWYKRAIHLLAVIGFFSPFILGALGLLGPDPAAALIDASGQIAIYSFAFTLLLPLIKTYVGTVLFYRRVIGIYSFVFASQHLLWVLLYELGFDFSLLIQLTVEKPFVWLGMLAWLSLLPVALTSFLGVQKRLRKRWKVIHQLVYFSAVAAALHYLLQLRGEWLTGVLILLVVATIIGNKLLRMRKV